MQINKLLIKNIQQESDKIIVQNEEIIFDEDFEKFR